MLPTLGVDTLILTGCSTSGCVRVAAVNGVQHGHRVIVPRECVGDRHAPPHDAALFDIHAKYGDVVSCAEAMACRNGLASALPESPAQAPSTLAFRLQARCPRPASSPCSSRSPPAPRPAGVGYQGRSLSEAAQWFCGSFNRLNDAAYSAGARTGERLGTAPPADNPRAVQFRPRQGGF